MIQSQPRSRRLRTAWPSELAPRLPSYRQLCGIQRRRRPCWHTPDRLRLNCVQKTSGAFPGRLAWQGRPCANLKIAEPQTGFQSLDPRPTALSPEERHVPAKYRPRILLTNTRFVVQSGHAKQSRPHLPPAPLQSNGDFCGISRHHEAGGRGSWRPHGRDGCRDTTKAQCRIAGHHRSSRSR